LVGDVGNPLTVKLTCSAGIPWLENCGLYGSRPNAVTDVTCTLRVPGVEIVVAAGGALQPSAITPPTANIGTTNSDLIAPMIVAESMEVENVTLAQS
jgi:hypothetical protein